MTFFDSNDIIQPGDLVLAWVTRTHLKPVIITDDADGAINTRFGSFPFSKIIGSSYGSQIPSTTGSGFIHVLKPTPELWTLSLPHRTQIVYTPDSSYIIQRLKVLPGSVVIEAGTGSGSFSHAFARSVGDSGKLYTYEFHESRFIEAQREFKEHGLLDNDRVQITHRDVCKDGFEIAGIDMIASTSVFLDLPSPWEAIPHLIDQKNIVNRQRLVSICCFSPCMEQVIKTVEALKQYGFQRIEMVEVQAKKWEAHKDMIKDVDEAVDRLRDIRKRRAEGLARRNARIEAEQASSTDTTEVEAEPKKRKAYEMREPNTPRERGYNPWGKGAGRIKEGDENYNWASVSKTEAELKTHTSYLTFALLPPRR